MRPRRAISRMLLTTRLKKALAKAHLWRILVMVWCVDAVRKNELSRVTGRFTFPTAAAGARAGQEYFVAPWVLETLVNEALIYPSAPASTKRFLDTSHWDSFSVLYNILHDLENAESLDGIAEADFLHAIPRITWRQFGWQMGYQSADRLYRAWRLYCFPEASSYFSGEYGITVERFALLGFIVASQVKKYPAILIDTSLTHLGVSDQERDAFFDLVVLPSHEARSVTKMERSIAEQIAYKPSTLRKHPMISIRKDDHIQAFCPLDDLLFLRITDGLYYDLVDSDDLKRKIGENFESFALEISAHYLSNYFETLPDEEYGPKGRKRATPDIRIAARGGKVRAVIECKARRLPFRVRSSPNPYLGRESDYMELVKGVGQIWKYVADVRQGQIDVGRGIECDAVGIVLTLDPWLQMSAGAIETVREKARLFVTKNHPDVKEVDQIKTTFVSIDDWEQSLRADDAEGFVAALMRHAESDRDGYMLRSTVLDSKLEHVKLIEPFDYHGKISKIVPWWAEIGEG
jgi:hypothetical protein